MLKPIQVYREILRSYFEGFSMKMTSSFFKITLLMITLVVFPGCSVLDWIKNKTSSGCTDCAGTGEAVITLNGKTMLTCDQFGEKLNGIYQSRQGIREIVAQMPEDKQLEVFDQIAEGLVAEHLIANDVKERKLVDKQIAEQAHKQLDVDLAVRAFQDQLTIEIQELMSKIDDAEAKSFYETNREKMPIFQQPPFLVNAAQVKAAADNKTPEKKVKPEYAVFDKVRELIKQVMMQERMPALYTDKMNELKQKHKVSVNKDCFKQFVIKNEASMMAEVPAAVEHVEAQTESAAEHKPAAMPTPKTRAA